jgi:hypothetical protein
VWCCWAVGVDGSVGELDRFPELVRLRVRVVVD